MFNLQQFFKGIFKKSAHREFSDLPEFDDWLRQPDEHDLRQYDEYLRRRRFSDNVIRICRRKRSNPQNPFIFWWREPRFTVRFLTLYSIALLAISIWFSGTGIRNRISHGISDGYTGHSASPEVVEVLFRYEAPGARTVEIIGDFTHWERGRYPLQRNENGIWEIRIRLPRGRYQYGFLIDEKKWFPDHSRRPILDDGFGHKNSLLEI